MSLNWTAAFAFLLLGAVLALPSTATENITYRRTTVVDSGNRVRFVLEPSDATQSCATLDDAGTTPVTARLNNAHIVADTFYESVGGSFGYVFWVIDRSGTHSVFRAHWYLQNCALSERRYDQAYFDSGDRYALAAERYRLILQENLRQ